MKSNETDCFNCNKAYLNCLSSCPNSPMEQGSSKVYQVVGKKPVYNCVRGALCPVCDGELYPKLLYVRRFKHKEIRIEEKTPYCKHCGHALDWSKESEGEG